jgi:hypothetical protein
MGYVTHPGTLYDYAAGVYCGVLVTEKVMKKLVALQHKHLEEVKRLLADQADQGNVFPSSWTLHYPGGKQTHVSYIDTSDDVKTKIKYATLSNQPKPCFPVFVANSMDEAKEMADQRYLEMDGNETNSTTM